MEHQYLFEKSPCHPFVSSTVAKKQTREATPSTRSSEFVKPPLAETSPSETPQTSPKTKQKKQSHVSEDIWLTASRKHLIADLTTNL